MSEPYLGQITMFGGSYAPRNFALCDGQILSISQYSALFSLIGTTYGGNGQTTFALPDLRSRLSIHMGQSAGLSNYPIGQSGGEAAVKISSRTMAGHSHSLVATTGEADTGTVGLGVVPAKSNGPHPAEFYADAEVNEPPLDKQAMNADVCAFERAAFS